MARLQIVTLISFLLAHCSCTVAGFRSEAEVPAGGQAYDAHGDYGNEASSSTTESTAIVYPEYHFPDSRGYMCRESDHIYECVFTNVAITRDTPSFFFGFANVAMNNQRSITFKNSHMRIMPAALVNSFRKVELLNLEGLQIEEIEPYAFENGGLIKELYLSFNDIQSLTHATVYGLAALEFLTLDRNEIRRLTSDVFYNTPNLKVLSMSNNKLERIEDGTFRRNTMLEDLQLASNKLTHVDLSLIPSLFIANVSFNQLTQLSVPNKIETLDASHNHIRSVLGHRNPNLTQLNLRSNNLTDTAWLPNFPSLQQLDLSYNELEKISANSLKKSHHLVKLLLQHNRLMSLNLGIALGELQVLDVSHNQVVYLDNNFKPFNKLQQLYLDHNSIVTIKIASNHSVQNLTMSHNDWDCQNLRNLNNLMDKLSDADQYCKVGYKLEGNLCCKEHDKPYLDRLNEQIKLTTIAEKVHRADGRCSANETLESIQTLSRTVEEAEAAGSSQNLKSEVSLLESTNRALQQQMQQKRETITNLLAEIDSYIWRYRVPKQGLVKASVNLIKVFNHLAARQEFRKNESKARTSAVDDKKAELDRLTAENELLRSETKGKRDQTKDLQTKNASRNNRIKQMQAKINNNPHAQRNHG
uniref:Leucine rich immune protein (Short) n=1 Tax=Anopheles farauti TaxID=69004 RepID=A0A182Q9B3_9DIPT